MYSGKGIDESRLIWASFANTFTAAGTATGNATLPGGAVGTPVVVKGSGTVSGQVALNVSNVQQVIAPVNPNASPSVAPVPKSAFPVKTGAVSLTLTGDGAGVVRALVGFMP